MDMDAVPKRKTYAQGWPAYNLAQNTEKHRFQELLADLCRGIEEPPPVPGKRGRKPHLLRDCVFSAALKVYSTFSTRRFQCDLTDAHDAGYLTADVPSMNICEFLQNDGPDADPPAARSSSQPALEDGGNRVRPGLDRVQRQPIRPLVR